MHKEKLLEIKPINLRVNVNSPESAKKELWEFMRKQVIVKPKDDSRFEECFNG